MKMGEEKTARVMSTAAEGESRRQGSGRKDSYERGKKSRNKEAEYDTHIRSPKRTQGTLTECSRRFVDVAVSIRLHIPRGSSGFALTLLLPSLLEPDPP